MNKYICLKDDTEFFDVSGKELICPVCGGREVRFLRYVEVVPLNMDFLDEKYIVKPLRMHNYYPASERDGL